MSESNAVVYDLSIILPIYHSNGGTLKRSLSAVASQPLFDFNVEVILVFDGPEEKLPVPLLEFSARTSDIKTVTIPHSGVSAARNAGIDTAKGKWVFFLDVDDYLPDGVLNRLLNIANESECDLLSANHSRLYSKKEILIRYYEKERTMAQSESIDYLRDVLSVGTDQGTVWAKLFRTSFLKDHEIKFSQNLSNGEDQEFLVRFVLCHPIITLSNINCYVYVVNYNSAVRAYRQDYLNQVIETVRRIKFDLVQARAFDRFSETFNLYCQDRFLLLLTNWVCRYDATNGYRVRKALFSKIVHCEIFSSAIASTRPKRMSLVRRFVIALARLNCFFAIDCIFRARSVLHGARDK